MHLREINRLFNQLLKHGISKRNKKIINYLRLYGHLMTAMTFLDARTYRKFRSYISLIKKLTQDAEFSEEHVYISRINEVAKSLLNYRRYKENKIGIIKTKLLVMQNICILRTLKAGS